MVAGIWLPAVLGPETPRSLWQQLGNMTLPNLLHGMKAMWKVQLLFKLSNEKPLPFSVVILSGATGCWNMLKCVGGVFAQSSTLLFRAALRTFCPQPPWSTVSLPSWVPLPFILPALQNWRLTPTAALPSLRIFVWVFFLICSHLMLLHLKPPSVLNLTGKDSNRIKNFWEACEISRYKECCYRRLFFLGSQDKNKVNILFHSVICILKACLYRGVQCLTGTWASSIWTFRSMTQHIWR